MTEISLWISRNIEVNYTEYSRQTLVEKGRTLFPECSTGGEQVAHFLGIDQGEGVKLQQLDKPVYIGMFIQPYIDHIT